MDQKLFHKVAKALSDPQRFALLERIARSQACPTCECPCATLVDEFPITQATISHHLKELSNAELITMRRSGKCGYFSVRADTLDAYRDELASRLILAKAPRPARPSRAKSVAAKK